VNHHTVQINYQPDATNFQFIILTFVYSSTCFGRFPAHHQELNDCSGSLWSYLRIELIVVLWSWSGRHAHHQELNNCSSSLWFYLRSVVVAVLLVVVRAAGRSDHDQQHCYHHAPKVKPETATAIVELLVMGVRTPETL
jgi:hypothetical protein